MLEFQTQENTHVAPAMLTLLAFEFMSSPTVSAFFVLQNYFSGSAFRRIFYCVDLLKENMAVKVKTKRERCINVVPFTLINTLPVIVYSPSKNDSSFFLFLVRLAIHFLSFIF